MVWGNKKQGAVDMSTVNAGFTAASHALKEAIVDGIIRRDRRRTLESQATL
jgi:hypothetical protein